MFLLFLLRNDNLNREMPNLFKKYILPIFSRPKEIFFRNLGLRQTLIKNTFWLAFAEGLSKVLKFFLFIYIARILGATEYGKFSFALAFAGLFLIFADLGIFKILTREFAKDPEKEKDFPALVSFKILLNIGTIILIFIGSFFITSSSLIRIIIWILGVEVLLNSFLVFFYAFFSARQKMEYQSWFQIIQAILVTSFGFFVLFNFPSAKNLSWAYLLGTLICLIFILIFFHFRFFPLKLSFDEVIWKKYLKLSYPLALAAFFGTIYSNTDSTIMGYFGQITQTGWYNAAQRIVMAVVIPAGFITMSFFPVLSKFFKQSKEKLQRVWNYYVETMIFLALPLVVGGIFLSRKIIDLIYDPSYFPSILAFQILLVGFAIGILTNPLNQALIIFNQQKKFFWIFLFGAIFNVVLNLILVPKYSLYGAAFTTLITFVLIFFLSFRITLRFTTLKPVNPKTTSAFLIAGVSSFFMYLIISWSKIYNLYVIWIVLIGFLAYLFFFLTFRIFWRYVKLKKA